MPRTGAPEAEARQVDPVLVSAILVQRRIDHCKHFVLHLAPAFACAPGPESGDFGVGRTGHWLCGAPAAIAGWWRSTGIPRRQRRSCIPQGSIESWHLRGNHDEWQVSTLNPSLVKRTMRQHPVEIIDGVTALPTSVEKQDHWPSLGRFGVIPDRKVDQILAPLARDLALVTLPQQLRLATATWFSCENETWDSQPRGYAENGDGEHSGAIASGTDSNSGMTMHKQMFPYPAAADNFELPGRPAVAPPAFRRVVTGEDPGSWQGPHRMENGGESPSSVELSPTMEVFREIAFTSA